MICVKSRVTSDFSSFSLKSLIETCLNRGSSKKAQQKAGIRKIRQRPRALRNMEVSGELKPASSCRQDCLCSEDRSLGL